MANKTISPKILEEAKKMYMEYIPVVTIAAQLGLIRSSLQYHASTWSVERELNKAEMFRAFSDQKKVIMTSMSSAALKILTRALEATARNEEAPTLREAGQTAMILESIDKILRLDDGKATEITEVKGTTTVELKKRLSSDPFTDVTWVDDIKGEIVYEE